ncbi:MAG: hypothetical protein SPK75_10745, partial [Victivallales bacterium]|nr:hypothetical protein [Victivallales bacterium]
MAIEAAVIPFPREETTPPVMKMCFVISLHPVKSCFAGELQNHREKIRFGGGGELSFDSCRQGNRQNVPPCRA